jgi:hypothetical protein
MPAIRTAVTDERPTAEDTVEQIYVACGFQHRRSLAGYDFPWPSRFRRCHHPKGESNEGGEHTFRNDLRRYGRSHPMRRLSLLLPAVVVFLFCAKSHAACTAPAPGATEAQVVTAINACSSSGGGTLSFAAGTYGPFTSNFTLPCKVTLSGPVVPYSQTHNQTAIFQGSSRFIGQPLDITSGCSSVQNIQYLEWDGKQPTTTGGGGGFIYVPAGANHLIIAHNYIHGMNAPSSDSYGDQNTQANGIYLDGSGTSTLTQDIIITLNEFGTETYQGDCAGAMTEQNTENGGGFCNGVGVHNQTDNVSIDHNIFQYLEQGAKSYEGNNGNPGSGGGNDNNFTLSYNTFRYIQRIAFETQANLTVANSSNPTLQYIQYNYFGNRYNGNGGQQNYEVSMANGCGNSSLVQCSGHLDYNVYVENVNNPEHSAGNEVWGDNNTTANYNLFQGYLAGAGGAIDWSQSGNFTFNNNIFNMYSGSGTNCATQGGGYWNNEGGNSPAYTPKSCTGNTYSNAGTGTYRSATPTISPVSGIFAGTQTVTLTNTGTNRDANTTIWYTTDGSSPVPGTAQHASSGGTITLTSSATIKVPAGPGAALPDTFLGPFWRIVTPAGGSASISNSHLFLGVPGGGNHDPLLPSNQAVRVVQTIGNEDFDVAIKIDSPLFATDGNTSQGLMVLSE